MLNFGKGDDDYDRDAFFEVSEQILESPQLLQELDSDQEKKLLRLAIQDVNIKISVAIAESGLHTEPLAKAFILGDVDSIEALLKGGQKLDGLDWEEDSPEVCVFWGKNYHVRADILRLLVEHGLNTDHRTSKGENLFHILAYYSGAYDYDAVESAELLEDLGIPVDDVSPGVITPLIYSVMSENASLVSFFIDKGVQIGRPNEDGDTPVHFAAGCSRVSLLDLLISNGADVDVANNGGFTPLHLACLANYKNNIALLIRKGAHVSAETKNGHTPLSLLNPNGDDYEECMELIVKELSRLAYQKSTVLDGDMNLVNGNPESRRYFESCRQELEEMDSTEFYDSYTYYAVYKMSTSIKKLSKLLMNREFVEEFMKNIGKFNIYWDDMRRIFQEAEAARDVSIATLKKLNAVLRHHLPDLVIRKIAENVVKAEKVVRKSIRRRRCVNADVNYEKCCEVMYQSF